VQSGVGGDSERRMGQSTGSSIATALRQRLYFDPRLRAMRLRLAFRFFASIALCDTHHSRI
jgi:hypothetical protein